MHSKLGSVQARRHPYQVYTGALLVIGGLPSLVGAHKPGSINAYLPMLLVYVWAAVVVAGGAVIVAAAVAKSPVTGLYLERVAHGPIAMMCAVYAGSVMALAGFRAAFAASLTAGIAAAAVVRAVQVSKTIRALRKVISEGGEAGPCSGGRP